MNRLSRAFLAAATITAVTVTGASFESALAAPPSGAHGGGHAAHGGGHGKADVAKSDVAKLQRDIERLTRRLDHAVRASRLDGLDQDTQDTLLGNVATDEAALEALATTVIEDTADLRQARHDVRAVRAENYVRVVNVLRQAVRVQEAAGDDAEASALVDDAVAKALAITASSSKSEVKAARAGLVAARALLDDDADATPETDPETDPETETPPVG